MSLETNKETNNAMDVDDDPTPNKIIMEEIQEKVVSHHLLNGGVSRFKKFILKHLC